MGGNHWYVMFIIAALVLIIALIALCFFCKPKNLDEKPIIAGVNENDGAETNGQFDANHKDYEFQN